MLTRVSRWIQGASTGRVALAALGLFITFTVLVLPRQAGNAGEAGGGAGSPDTSFIYSPADLYRFAEVYGVTGRQAYIRARLTFDVVWPLVYAAFLCTAISWLLRRTLPAGSPWQRANLVPVFGALLDYLENLSTSIVMLRFPDPTPVVAWLAPAFTLAKWLLVGGSFGLLVVGAAAALLRWRAGRRA
jgi:hypothetical protein